MSNQQLKLFEGEDTVWEIKKHSSLVQMGNITTMRERKALNALIYIAKDQLKREPNKREFTCDLGVIKRLTGWENTNANDLKNALRNLVDTKIEYNIFQKDKEERGIFAILARAKVEVQGSGKSTKVTFEFPSIVLETVQHPRIYVKLNLLVLRGLSSKHSLALYEFLSDYFNLHTFRCATDDFRRLMGIKEGQYTYFTMLRKRVLDVAVTEINEKTDLTISYDLEKVGRKITAIVFSMKQKKEVLDADDPRSAIREKLQSFGLTESTIATLLERHDEAYLWVNMSVVEEQYRKGKIKNIAGYLLKAFEDDYSQQKSTIPTLEEEQQAIIEAGEQDEDQKKRFEQERKKRVAKYVGVLSEEEHAQLKEAFLVANTENLWLKKLQEKNDFSHPAIQAIYSKRVAKNRLPKKWHSFEDYTALGEVDVNGDDI